MKKFLFNSWPIILILALSVFIVWPVFVSGYFSHHDDLQVMRIFEMRKCFADLQIPCRWVPDMGYGNGYPLFNFYGVLPYYIGAIASFVLGFIGSAKFLFLLPLVLGGVGMYFLAKELFGKVPGVVGAVLYLFAPYRALDAYVRGAVGESFGLALIPLVFYFLLKLIKSGEKKYFAWGTIITALFLMSHNIMTLIFTPVIIAWIIFLLYKEENKNLKLTVLSLIIAFGLAAFFIIPAFMEKNLIQTAGLTQGELNFRAQFVKVSQLFTDRSWSYAASDPLGPVTISFQIGWPHWILAVLALIGGLLAKKRKDIATLVFFFLMFGIGAVMTHNKSAPIWETFKILSFVQFPWRFLSFAVFFSSLLGAYFVGLLKGKWLMGISAVLVIATVALNWQYFKPGQFYYGITDNQKLSGESFVEQQGGAVLDYLPLTATEPKELAPKDPYVVSGAATIENFVNKSNSWQFSAKVEKDAVVEVPVFYFPGWKVNYPYEVGTIGRIAVKLPVGEQTVIGKFTNTPVRTIANTLTVISALVFAGLIIYGKNRKVFI